MRINSLSIAGNGGEAPAPVVIQKSSVPAAPAPAVVPAGPSEQETQAAVEQINRALRDMNNSIQFEIDKGTGKTIVRVIDGETQDVLMQYPSEQALAIARSLENGPGALLEALA